MLRSQYVSKVIKQTVGVMRETDVNSSFRKAHLRLSDEQYQNLMQFVLDFTFCFVRIRHDYFVGEVNFPVEEVARDIIEELIKSHYPAKYMVILDDKECQRFISSDAENFKRSLMSGFNKPRQKHTPNLNNPLDFGAFFGHQLVNVIEPHLAELEKRDEFIPLQLHQNGQDEEGLGRDG